MDKVQIVKSSQLKRIWCALTVLAVALILSATTSVFLRWSMNERLAAIVDAIRGSKIVFPPTVVTKYAENRYDLSKCMSMCVENRDGENAEQLCEICLLDAEVAGFGCGMAHACETPTSVSVSLPLETSDAP